MATLARKTSGYGFKIMKLVLLVTLISLIMSGVTDGQQQQQHQFEDQSMFIQTLFGGGKKPQIGRSDHYGHDDHHGGYGHDDHHSGYGHDDHHGGYPTRQTVRKLMSI
jgi:hypothetical protein